MLGADDFKNLRHVSCENFAKLKPEFLGHMEDIMFLLFFFNQKLKLYDDKVKMFWFYCYNISKLFS